MNKYNCFKRKNIPNLLGTFIYFKGMENNDILMYIIVDFLFRAVKF